MSRRIEETIGKVNFDNGDRYEGSLVDNKMHGYGVLHYSDGTYYKGNFHDDERSGFGVLYNERNWPIYQGSWARDLMDGVGQFNYANGDRYNGHWHQGKRFHIGYMVYWHPPEGLNLRSGVYMGQWKDDMMDGYGTYIEYEYGVAGIDKAGNEVIDAMYGPAKIGTWKQNELIGFVIVHKDDSYSYRKEQFGYHSNNKGMPLQKFGFNHDLNSGDFALGKWTEIRPESFKFIPTDGTTFSTDSSIFSNTTEGHKEIQFLDYYHPYRNGTNSRFNEFSSRLLQFKSHNQHVDEFASRIIEKFDWILSDIDLIVVVPSHKSGVQESANHSLAKKLCERYANISLSGINALNRKKTIDKLSAGGNRQMQVHLDSISIEESLVANKRVLILDDVTTTGSSLLASKILLNRAKAQDVKMLAIGKTWSDSGIQSVKLKGKGL